MNLGLDLVLIAGMGFGIQVSALTNVLGQALATKLCARYIWRHHRDLLLRRENFALDRRLHFDMVTQGLSMSFMNCIYAVGSLILQRAINALGNAIITTHNR